MMHPNFYHWHRHTELKTEANLLQTRWDSAAKFAEELSADLACSLLRLALFGIASPEFAKRFSEKMISLEPTFLPEDNKELLRVMATAALYSHFENESQEADAVALGVIAASFQTNRIQPVCKELTQRANEYLTQESERMRPTPNLEGEYKDLKNALEDANFNTNPVIPQLLGNVVLELVKKLERISEENQFLWWLLGRKSSLLNRRRDQITQKEYAIAAAAEAAGRVALLPPPLSVEPLIEEVLTHCSDPSTATSTFALIDFIDAMNFNWVKAKTIRSEAREILPITSLIEIRRGGDNIDVEVMKMLHVNIFESQCSLKP